MSIVPLPDAARTRCAVCGFMEVRTDEVAHGGPLLLAECPRCEHRWTQRAPLGPPLRACAPRGAREIVPAA